MGTVSVPSKPYWSRYILINRYQDAPKSVYNDLYNLIRDKDNFVLTTNVDHCFQKAGFDKRRLSVQTIPLWRTAAGIGPQAGTRILSSVIKNRKFCTWNWGSAVEILGRYSNNYKTKESIT